MPSVAASIAVIILSYIFWAFGNFGQLAILITAPPVYAGFYGYLFKRIDGEKPGISSLFDCCRGVGIFFKSLVMVGLRGFVAKILSLCVLFLYASGNLNFFEGSESTVRFVLSVLADICSLFFLFMPYLYVKDRNIGVSAALKKSARLALKYLLVFIAIRIAVLLPSIIHVTVSFSLDPDLDFAMLMEQLQITYPLFAIEPLPIDIIIKAFSIWAEFTAVYIIFKREGIDRDNLGDLY